VRKTIIGIYGASGFGKEVLPLVREKFRNNIDNNEIVYIDDTIHQNELLNHKIIPFNKYLSLEADNKYVVIAIGESKVREKLTNICIENDLKLVNIRASNAVIMDNVKIGEGHIISPFVTLTSDIIIGRSFQANIYSYVAHDCIIGDYVTFAPAVKCNGNIHVGDHAYIGTGAIIKQGRPEKPIIIGKGSVIGAGAVVTKSIPAGMTVFGNPAIEFTKENVKRRS
jgi:sugar O-acyltransferase (sialic acid O-acetyltransferase NeuD family)